MAGGFRTSGIAGNIIIWREGFASGPVSYHFNNKEFFKRRKQFWNQYKKVVTNDSIPAYESYFIPEIEKINRINKSSDIYLWFEHDLFCQVNMIAILSLIYRGKTGKRTYLVSIDHHKNYSDFKGLGNLSPEDLFQLLPEAQQLDEADLKFADLTWQKYCKNDPLELQSHLSTTFPENYRFLKIALKYHMKRFPSVENGLNSIEKSILDQLISPIQERTIVKNLLGSDNYYGFGDLEYFYIISKLSPFYSILENGLLQINKRGETILKNEEDLFQFDINNYFVGGAQILSKPQWRVDSSGKLISYSDI